MDTFKVYAAIVAVQRQILAQGGIVKGNNNKQQGYKFRSIDDVYRVISPLIAECGLCILPRVLSHTMKERTTAKGTIMYHVVIEADFDFISIEDGSKHTVRTIGEAMDTGDKASNKAMSVAYKYACFQSFAIPTEGTKDNDTDYTTPEETVTGDRAGQPSKPQQSQQQKPQSKPLAMPRTNSKNVIGLCKHIATLDVQSDFISYATTELPKKKLTPMEKQEVINYLKSKGESIGLHFTNRLWVPIQNQAGQQSHKNGIAVLEQRGEGGGYAAVDFNTYQSDFRGEGGL